MTASIVSSCSEPKAENVHIIYLATFVETLLVQIIICLMDILCDLHLCDMHTYASSHNAYTVVAIRAGHKCQRLVKNVDKLTSVGPNGIPVLF